MRKKKEKPIQITDEEFEHVSNFLLNQAHDRFKESGNPLEVLRAFIDAKRNGINIPQWVLDHLERSFAAVLEGRAENLDKASGLDQGRGRRKWTTIEEKEETEEILRMRLSYLRVVFKCTAKEAIRMVAAHGDPAVKEEWLERKLPGQRRHVELFAKLLEMHNIQPSEEAKKKYLKQYPKSCLPERLKMYLEK